VDTREKDTQEARALMTTPRLLGTLRGTQQRWEDILAGGISVCKGPQQEREWQEGGKEKPIELRSIRPPAVVLDKG
jgi:hypothetical protein